MFCKKKKKKKRKGKVVENFVDSFFSLVFFPPTSEPTQVKLLRKIRTSLF